MFRYLIYSLAVLLVLQALFGVAAGLLELEPRSGAVAHLGLVLEGEVPARVVLGSWLLEALGLVALYLLLEGRSLFWWLDGLVAGSVAWIFRGPLLVITVVLAAGLPQEPWWTLAFGWWVLYSLCGLSLAVLARLWPPFGRRRAGAARAAAPSGPPAAAE